MKINFFVIKLLIIGNGFKYLCRKIEFFLLNNYLLLKEYDILVF